MLFEGYKNSRKELVLCGPFPDIPGRKKGKSLVGGGHRLGFSYLHFLLAAYRFAGAGLGAKNFSAASLTIISLSKFTHRFTPGPHLVFGYYIRPFPELSNETRAAGLDAASKMIARGSYLIDRLKEIFYTSGDQ